MEVGGPISSVDEQNMDNVDPVMIPFLLHKPWYALRKTADANTEAKTEAETDDAEAGAVETLSPISTSDRHTVSERKMAFWNGQATVDGGLLYIKTLTEPSITSFTQTPLKMPFKRRKTKTAARELAQVFIPGNRATIVMKATSFQATLAGPDTPQLRLAKCSSAELNLRKLQQRLH